MTEQVINILSWFLLCTGGAFVLIGGIGALLQAAAGRRAAKGMYPYANYCYVHPSASLLLCGNRFEKEADDLIAVFLGAPGVEHDVHFHSDL